MHDNKKNACAATCLAKGSLSDEPLVNEQLVQAPLVLSCETNNCHL